LQEQLITFLFFSLKFYGKIEAGRKRYLREMAGGFAIFTSYPAFYRLLFRKKEKKNL